MEQSTGGGGSNFGIGTGNFGLGSGFSGFTPSANYPDDNIAVGKDQIVQVVNNSYMVFDKSVSPLLPSPVDIGQMLAGCHLGTPIGHPIAQYDRIADRWIIAENTTNGSSGTYSTAACIFVSKTSDATGEYFVYPFGLGDNGGYMDLPKWGVMPTGFFQSNDNFGLDGDTFQGAFECAYDRVAMEKGDPADQVCFQLTTHDFALLPADLDSTQPPPNGQDEFLFSLWDSSNLALYSFHTDWVEPMNAFITGSGGSQLFAVPSFTPACDGLYLGACVPQQTSDVLLNVLGDRLLYRVAYSNDVPPFVPKTALPPHFQHWLVMHDVTASGGNTAERWYELFASYRRPIPVTNIGLLQSGTYSPDSTNHRWMGSIARDKDSNILMGYSVSSTSFDPGIAITGRTGSDSPGTMESELGVVDGQGAYLGTFDFNLNRWGDYTSMRLDPADNCTFWYTNELYQTSGIANWSTVIFSACFSECTCGPMHMRP